MPTETVDIVVRQRGAQRVGGELRGVGGSAAGAAGAVKLLTGALVALASARVIGAAVRGLTNLARNAVDTSARFEQFGIRLRALLGSQAAANRSFEEFVRLSSRTPFAVDQIVEGATTLASVVQGNEERLQRLTRVSANLAAVTGLSFEQTASNLQRALASGIGAADLFRERGVRQLVEGVTGIPDLTKVPLEELEAAFVQTFGELGRFGTAAEDLSLTTSGAISNIGDAATNLQAALGDALSPVVIAAAREVLIPFLERLRDLILENRGAITAFATEGLDAFLEFIQGAIENVRGLVLALNLGGASFDRIGGALSLVATASGALSDIIDGTLSLAFQNFFEGAAVFIDGLLLGIRTIGAALVALVRPAVALGARLGLISEETRAAFDNFSAELNQSVVEGAFALEERFGLAFGNVEDNFRVAGNRLAADLVERFGDAQEALQRVLNPEDDADLIRQLDAIADRIGVARDRARELVAEILASREAAAAATDDVTPPIGEDAVDEPNIAKALGRALTAGVNGFAEDGDVQGIFAGVAEAFGVEMADSLQSSLVNALKNTANLFGDIFDDQIKQLGKSLNDVFSDVLGQDAGQFGSALGGVLGIAGGLVGGFLQDSSARTSSNLVRSAVDATETLTRGVVAGPTNVPIFEVAGAIGDAFVETNSLLSREIALSESTLQTLRNILAAVSAGGGGGAGGLLTTTSPSLG